MPNATDFSAESQDWLKEAQAFLSTLDQRICEQLEGPSEHLQGLLDGTEHTIDYINMAGANAFSLYHELFGMKANLSDSLPGELKEFVGSSNIPDICATFFDNSGTRDSIMLIESAFRSVNKRQQTEAFSEMMLLVSNVAVYPRACKMLGITFTDQQLLPDAYTLIESFAESEGMSSGLARLAWESGSLSEIKSIAKYLVAKNDANDALILTSFIDAHYPGVLHEEGKAVFSAALSQLTGSFAAFSARFLEAVHEKLSYAHRLSMLAVVKEMVSERFFNLNAVQIQQLYFSEFENQYGLLPQGLSLEQRDLTQEQRDFFVLRLCLQQFERSQKFSAEHTCNFGVMMFALDQHEIDASLLERFYAQGYAYLSEKQKTQMNSQVNAKLAEGVLDKVTVAACFKSASESHPQAMSAVSRFVRRYQSMSLKWKVLSVISITLGAAAIGLGLFFPPLAMMGLGLVIGGASLAGVSAVGHTAHIATTPIDYATCVPDRLVYGARADTETPLLTATCELPDLLEYSVPPAGAVAGFPETEGKRGELRPELEEQLPSHKSGERRVSELGAGLLKPPVFKPAGPTCASEGAEVDDFSGGLSPGLIIGSAS